MSVCRILGCSSNTAGYSAFCDNHKRRNRRHGHPDQRGVTAREMESFRVRVAARMEKNRDNPTWSLLGDRWMRLVTIATTEEGKYLSGAPHNVHQREAWDSISKIGLASSSKEVVEMALAVYLLQDDNPHRFKSDEAFGSQLVRRVRSLAPSSIGSYHDDATSKTKKVYRDTKPKTTAILAKILQETFGVAGLAVARLEQQERDKQYSGSTNPDNSLS